MQSLSPGFPLPRTWTIEQPLDESPFISVTAQVNGIEDLISIIGRSLFVSFELEPQRLGLADAWFSKEYQAVLLSISGNSANSGFSNRPNSVSGSLK